MSIIFLFVEAHSCSPAQNRTLGRAYATRHMNWEHCLPNRSNNLSRIQIQNSRSLLGLVLLDFPAYVVFAQTFHESRITGTPRRCVDDWRKLELWVTLQTFQVRWPPLPSPPSPTMAQILQMTTLTMERPQDPPSRARLGKDMF